MLGPVELANNSSQPARITAIATHFGNTSDRIIRISIHPINIRIQSLLDHDHGLQYYYYYYGGDNTSFGNKDSIDYKS